MATHSSILAWMLIVSLVVQKLLILIRSHLFIFAFISNILGPLCPLSWVMDGKAETSATMLDHKVERKREDWGSLIIEHLPTF